MNKILDPAVEQEKLDKQADITDLRAKYETLGKKYQNLTSQNPIHNLGKFNLFKIIYS